MLLRITNGTLRSSLWLLGIATVLIAVYLLLGRALVYSMAANKDRIETFLHENGLQHVTIDDAEGDWLVFDPVFSFSNVQLKREADIVFQIDSLRVRLDSIRSLMQRSPVVSEIEVAGIHFTLVANGDGIHIKGLPRGTGEFNLDPLLDTVPYLNEVVLSGVDVGVQGRDYLVYLRSESGEPWRISGDTASKAVKLPMYVVRDLNAGVRKNRIHLTGTYQGDVRTDDFSASLYLSAPDLELANFLPEIRFRDQRLTSAHLSTQIWFEATPNQIEAVGGVSLSSVVVTREENRDTLLDMGDVQFKFVGESFLDGSLTIPMVELRQADLQYNLNNIAVAIESRSDGLAIGAEVPLVDVGDLGVFVEFAGNKNLIPPRLSSALSVVNPRGELQDVAFHFSQGNGEPKLVGRLVNFAMDAYLGVPAIDPLSGFISAQPTKGYLDIDNDAFVMNFSNMFAESWPFDSGRGRVAYEIADGDFKVESGLIELLYGDLEVYGKVALNLPPVRDLQTWGLTMGISNANLLETTPYIPNIMPETLVDWLNSAVLAGHADQTGLTFHGALFRGAPKVRKAHDLYFKVRDTSMKYHVDWPVIDEASATVHVNNHYVRSNDMIGHIYDSGIETATLNMPLTKAGHADTILVNAVGVGPFSDLIRSLNETPLAQTTANMAEQWSGSGDMRAEMKLNVPIGNRTGEEVVTEVMVSFSQSELVMPEFDLTISKLGGSAGYSTSHGLHSDGFTGVTFQEGIEGDIATALHGDGGEIKVTVDGVISAESLYEWSDQVLLSRAEGQLGYRAIVHVPYGGSRDEAYVEASSNMSGMSLDLPYPLGKLDAEENRKFTYSQYFREDSYLIEMSLDDSIKASLKVADGIAVGGRVHFGETPRGAVTYDQIRMTGQLERLDFAKWLVATEELGEITDVSLEDEIAAHVESAILDIDELLLYELSLEQAAVKVTRENAAWLASIENEMLLGNIRVADADLEPIDISLDRLSFENDGEEGDPLGDVAPLEIDDINFRTASLVIDDEDYGAWAFQYRVVDDVARFEQLEANAAGLRVLPTSTLEWRSADGMHQTHYSGDIEVDDLALALQKFGFASSIEGQGLKVGANVGWTGSPAMVDVERVVGNVVIHEGKGRFVQAETGGALKLLGIFDFASIARRLRLDFSDVVEKGFEFSEISGVTAFNEGQVGMAEPIVIEGSSGKFTLGGSVDLTAGTLDNEMIVTLPVTRTLPWYAAYSAIATGPLAGAGVWVAQKVFENQIDQMSSAKYKISGTLDEPDIEFVAIFDDKVAKTTVEQTETP